MFVGGESGGGEHDEGPASVDILSSRHEARARSKYRRL